jgi:hypothetical protein
VSDEVEHEREHAGEAHTSEGSGPAMLTPSRPAARHPLILSVGGVLLAAIAAGAFVLLNPARATPPHPAAGNPSAAQLSRAASGAKAHLPLGVKHVRRGSATASLQLRRPCLDVRAGRRLCGWAAAQQCTRTISRLPQHEVIHANACLRVLRRFNAERSRQYILSQEPHE